MNALQATLQAYDASYANATHRKAQKRQKAYQNSLTSLLGGGGGNPSGVPYHTPPIVPPNSAQSAPSGLKSMQGGNAPAMPQIPTGGVQGASQPDYAAAAQLAAQNGYTDDANNYMRMAAQQQAMLNSQAKADAASAQTAATADQQGQMTLYRIGKGVLDGAYTLDEAKAFLQQNGADPQELAQITDQTLPGQIAMLERKLGSQGVLKANEAVYDQLTGQIVTSNRGPQVVADGSALVGADGTELYANQADAKLPTGMRIGANGQPEYIPGYLEGQKQLKQAGRSTTEINLPGQQTAGRKKLDELAAADIYAWQSGGAADTMKQINQLASSLGVLNSDQKITGFISGNTPEPLLAIFRPEAVEVREQVAEVVQRNLRVILGAQFTEKEGNQLISRAFNARLPQETQARRVQNLLTQMQLAAEAKGEMADYFNKNGTLIGYEGRRPSLADFEDAVRVKGQENNAPSVTTGSLSRSEDGGYVWSPG